MLNTNRFVISDIVDQNSSGDTLDLQFCFKITLWRLKEYLKWNKIILHNIGIEDIN